jgi:hypothetical protein
MTLRNPLGRYPTIALLLSSPEQVGLAGSNSIYRPQATKSAAASPLTEFLKATRKCVEARQLSEARPPCPLETIFRNGTPE